MGYSKSPKQLQSSAALGKCQSPTTTSAGREPATIHTRALSATYYATGEDDMNGYCKLNINSSPLLQSCGKLILVFSKCICA